jgi:hypothetical protein
MKYIRQETRAKVAPQPFIRPAFDANVAASADRIERAAVAALEEALTTGHL